MLPLKAIGVIGALAVGVIIVAKVVTSSSGEQTPFVSGGGVGSALGGLKAGDTIYNFPAPTFPEMPVYEMPEALVNEIVEETTPTKKAMFSQEMGAGQLPLNQPQKVFLDLLSIKETGVPVGVTKKEAVKPKPVGWGAYAPSSSYKPSQPKAVSTPTKKEILTPKTNKLFRDLDAIGGR